MDDRTKDRLVSALDLDEPMVLLDERDARDDLPVLERGALGISSMAMGLGTGGLVASAFMNAALPMAVLGGGALMVGMVHAFLSVERVEDIAERTASNVSDDFYYRKRVAGILESGDFEVKVSEKGPVLGTSGTLDFMDVRDGVLAALKRNKKNNILKEIAKGAFGGLVLMSAICSRVPEIVGPVKSYLSTVLPDDAVTPVPVAPALAPKP